VTRRDADRLTDALEAWIRAIAYNAANVDDETRETEPREAVRGILAKLNAEPSMGDVIFGAINTDPRR
jgi:hypothetical protein